MNNTDKLHELLVAADPSYVSANTALLCAEFMKTKPRLRPVDFLWEYNNNVYIIKTTSEYIVKVLPRKLI